MCVFTSVYIYFFVFACLFMSGLYFFSLQKRPSPYTCCLFPSLPNPPPADANFVFVLVWFGLVWFGLVEMLGDRHHQTQTRQTDVCTHPIHGRNFSERRTVQIYPQYHQAYLLMLGFPEKPSPLETPSVLSQPPSPWKTGDHEERGFPKRHHHLQSYPPQASRTYSTSQTWLHRQGFLSDGRRGAPIKREEKRGAEKRGPLFTTIGTRWRRLCGEYNNPN